MKAISRSELADRLGTPEVVVVNVLAKDSYDKIHIKGSISIPRSELEAGRWAELDRNKVIITHCSSYECEASRAAARFLEERGFDVRAYEGGMKEWAEAGLPTEGRLSPEQFLAERYGPARANATPP